MRVYLDNSATTQASEPVMQAMRYAMTDGYFNPSALYAPALAAEQAMDACRQAIVGELGAQGRVLFTSGGTEANNLAILGALKRRREKGELLYSAGEHPSVIESCKAAESMGYSPVEIPLDSRGLADLPWLEAHLGPQTAMICLMHVNNEIGAIQPLEVVAALRKRLCPQAFFHVDGVQAFLRLPCDTQAWGIDSYALSGHKLHGPKGIGALWLRKDHKTDPILFGGGQEEGLRSGTENTPGIAGLRAAIESYPRQHRMREFKLRLFRQLSEGIPGCIVNGPPPDSKEAAPHILNLSFPPVRSETLLHALEAEGVLVGNGSACSSRKRKLSHVLLAMGLPPDQIACAIRFSLSSTNTEADIDAAVQAVQRCYAGLKDYTRR